MRYTRTLALGLAAVVGGWVGPALAQDAPVVRATPTLDVQGQAQSSFIFRFRNDVSVAEAKGLARAFATEGGGSVRHVFAAGSSAGFSANMSDVAAARLAREHSEIAGYERNGVARIAKKPDNPGGGGGGGGKGGGNGNGDGDSSTNVPWGVARVTGNKAGKSYEADLVDCSAGYATAWVLDTGIDLSHPDLNVDAVLSERFGPYADANDQHGHGTHVAGTIAAVLNGQVAGVCPGAKVVAVRVLGSNGTGNTDDVTAGVNHVLANANPGDVLNISLISDYDTLLEQYIFDVAANGIHVSIAAGNGFIRGGDANSTFPANMNHDTYIYTVSAHDSGDKYARFSNYGNPPIDFAAPGVNIESLWKDGGTNTISGTSMAAPHVSGLLLRRQTSPGCDGNVSRDPDSSPDPIAHLVDGSCSPVPTS